MAMISLLLGQGAEVNLSFGGGYRTALGVTIRWSNTRGVSVVLLLDHD